MQPVHTVGLATKVNDTQASDLAEEIAAWLKGRGVKVLACDKGNGPLRCPADLIVAVGGDGTIIRVARRIVGAPVPLVGVNMGRVGFLAELDRQNWRVCLASAIHPSANMKVINGNLLMKWCRKSLNTLMFRLII
jgi:NAD+ kinase